MSDPQRPWFDTQHPATDSQRPWIEEPMSEPGLCRCGRPVFYALDNPIPLCPACEFMPAATCDCVATT